MQQTIEGRGGHARVPKDLPPLADAPVGGQPDGAALLPAREKWAEEGRPMLVNRDVADLVDAQQLGQTIVLEALLPSMLGLGLGQRGEEAHRRGGPRRIPRLDRFQAGSDRPRGRPRAWLAQEDRMVPMLDEPTGGQLLELLPIARGVTAEVETL
jgi:hypothetical protein